MFANNVGRHALNSVNVYGHPGSRPGVRKSRDGEFCEGSGALMQEHAGNRAIPDERCQGGR